MRLHSAHKRHKDTKHRKHALPYKGRGIVSVKQKRSGARPLAPKRWYSKVGDLFVSLFNFLKKIISAHKYISSGVFVFVILFFVLSQSSVLEMTNISIVFPQKSGCVTEKEIREKALDERSYPWSYLFRDNEDLLKKRSCIKSIHYEWNPFLFKNLKVIVQTEVPLYKVIVMTIDITEPGAGYESYLSAPVLKEDVQYVTSRGSMISLQEDQDLFSFRYRVRKDTRVDSLSSDILSDVFQLKDYFEKTYSVTPQIELTQEGTLRLPTAFSENVLLTVERPLDQQLGSLQAVLTQSTIDKTRIRLIDVRFGNPVVQLKI